MVMATNGNTPYDHITNAIIAALEAGNVVWHKPWKVRKPCNAITGKAYRGINPFLLMLAGDYTDHRWLTFKQAQELGGTVKKGEKATWIVFSSPNTKTDDDGKVVSRYWIMRAYKVFNVEQCENLTKLAPLEECPNQDADPDILAEAIWAKYADAPNVKTGGSVASYSPSLDVINMPTRGDFESNAHYYATLFHEGIHSTGHKDRLARKSLMESDGFGGYVYSLEELVAEFGSAFLVAEAGMDAPTRENTVAYLQGWIQKLKDDHTLVVKAASQAQTAADYILGVKAKDEPTTAEVETVEAVAV